MSTHVDIPRRTRQRAVKRSAGIACCRYNNERKCYEILLVKKRCSYNFVAFVLGYYSKNDDKRIRYLFNGMTHAEKVSILSLKYEHIWYHTMLQYPDYLDINSDRMSKGDINAYLKKKNKFESTFVIDGGKKLRRIINGTNNMDLIWEIPKGRKTKNELTVDTARREFMEETGMRPLQFSVLSQVSPVSESYANMGTTYVNKYYIAHSDSVTNPHMCFTTNIQISEVEDVQWLNTADIRQRDNIGRLSKQVAKIFSIYRSHRKRHVASHNTTIKMVEHKDGGNSLHIAMTDIGVDSDDSNSDACGYLAFDRRSPTASSDSSDVNSDMQHRQPEMKVAHIAVSPPPTIVRMNHGKPYIQFINTQPRGSWRNDRGAHRLGPSLLNLNASAT